MLFLVRVLRFIDRLSDVSGRAVAWCAGLMMAVTCYIVVARYLFNGGSVGVQELLTYLNALLFTVGAAYTLKEDGHVRVDIFYGNASARAKAWTNLLGVLVLLLPVCVFLLWTCWSYVGSSWAIHEKSGDTGGLPWVYLLKTLILVMAGLLLLQGIGEGLRSVLTLRRPELLGSGAHHEEHAL